VDSNGQWHSSGATVGNLSVGSHTVSFSTISGWTTPGNQTVSVTANSTATTSGAYVPIPQYGSLQVTITPFGAVSAGAQWQVDNNGQWQSSGATVGNLSVGNHTVSFSTISGWTTPGNQTVSVTANSTVTSTGTYVPVVGPLPPELTGMNAGNALFTFVVHGPVGSNYVVEVSSNLVDWLPLSTNTIPSGGSISIVDPLSPSLTKRFYRAVPLTNSGTAPSNMMPIPTGSFQMGDTFNEGDSGEIPVHAVYVSAFYMDKYLVTKALWGAVYEWATIHGYSFDNGGSGKAANHPVQSVNWYDMVKWCNARSEKEGRTPAYYTGAAQAIVYRTGQVDVQNGWVNWNVGYRLPTEAEWEKAARGGLNGQRFPWGDTIDWGQANYNAFPLSAGGYAYDVNPTAGFDPAYDDGVLPYTSPVGAFPANGYGLYDMAGNVWQWCWDWDGSYSSGSQTDPRGPASGSHRVIRGGSWTITAMYCRSASRLENVPTAEGNLIGFRSVLPPDGH
jgi:formylglycine-generating enzyme required for sulfatase activity